MDEKTLKYLIWMGILGLVLIALPLILRAIKTRMDDELPDTDEMLGQIEAAFRGGTMTQAEYERIRNGLLERDPQASARWLTPREQAELVARRAKEERSSPQPLPTQNESRERDA